MLTRKQHDLLLFIHDRLSDSGVPPSFDEMKDALELKSKSGIHRLITALEERGFIRRLPHRARAIEVVKLPDGTPNGRQGGFKPQVIQGTAPAAPVETRPEMVEIDLVGRIAAGLPIEAIDNGPQPTPVPASMLRSGTHFALEVRGDSMTGAGILDGDIVLIQETSTANNGEIVVALVAGQEATLKRLRKRGASVALEAENPDYETRIYGPDEVEVQGRLVGLLRHY